MKTFNTIDTTAFVNELKEQTKPFDIIVPEAIIELLIKRHVAICDNGAEHVKQDRLDFPSNNIEYAIDARVYPALKQTDVTVIRKSHPAGRVFTFTHAHVTNVGVTAEADKVETETKTEKEVKVNNSANIIRTNSFRAAADMIEAVFNVEDWRRDGTIEDMLKAVDINERKTVKANDMEDITIFRPEFINSYKGIKVEATYNSAKLVFIVSPERKEEHEEDDGYRAPFKNFMSGVRTKLFLNKLKHASTPMEAFNLVSEWLGDDQEFEGKFVYKDMVVLYSFEFDKDGSSIRAEVTVGNKVKCEGCGKSHDMEIIFQLKSNITAQNVEKFYNSVKSFGENFIK